MQTARQLRMLGIVGVAMLLATGCASGVSGRGISVKDAMARPSPLEGGTGGAFLTIVNNGPEPDHLLSASSPAAGAIELHETVDDNGVMRMVPHPEGWEIPALGTLELKPGGKHLMLIKLARPLEAGQTVQITLTFRNAGPVTVRVPIKLMSE